MLCSQIRLNERRCSVPRRSFLLKGKYHPSTDIVQRPCVIRNILNTSSSSSSSSSSRDHDDHRVDGDRPGSRMKSCRAEKIKLPLRTYSLRMQPGTKTLAPGSVRRDPRKQPSFCEHLNHMKRMKSTCHQLQNDFLVRGIEISQGCSLIKKDKSNFDDENVENINLNIELTECCHCMDDSRIVDRLKIEQLLEDECKIQIYENIIENSKEEIDCLAVVSSAKKVEKEPTPRTMQVISVTLNNKKNE